GGNPVKPCAELAFAMERAELGDDFDEHLLRHFFCIMRVKNHPNGNVVNPCLMPQHQFLKGRSITGLCSLDEDYVIGVARGSFCKGIEHVLSPQWAVPL